MPSALFVWKVVDDGIHSLDHIYGMCWSALHAAPAAPKEDGGLPAPHVAAPAFSDFWAIISEVDELLGDLSFSSQTAAASVQNAARGDNQGRTPGALRAHVIKVYAPCFPLEEPNPPRRGKRKIKDAASATVAAAW